MPVLKTLWTVSVRLGRNAQRLPTHLSKFIWRASPLRSLRQNSLARTNRGGEDRRRGATARAIDPPSVCHGFLCWESLGTV